MPDAVVGFFAVVGVVATLIGMGLLLLWLRGRGVGSSGTCPACGGWVEGVDGEARV